MTNDHEPETASGDLTPEVGAATDIAPLGRSQPKPAHELTASEDDHQVDWSRVTRTPAFREMIAAKRRFIIPATLVFLVYYFSLPVLVGYAPGFMSKKVIGPVNIAYLFALSQFFMAWIIAALYLRRAAQFDRMEDRAVDRAESARGGNN